MSKKSISEKEQELLKTIEQAKNKLNALQQKQKIKIGELAIKYNLHLLDEKTLDSEFKKLASGLNFGN